VKGKRDRQVKAGDLIGYFNMDQKIEYGIVLSGEPYNTKDEYSEDICTVVDVAWPEDIYNCDGRTKERIETILSEEIANEYIWLESSS